MNDEEVEWMNSDFDALLSQLAQHRVKYLIVGVYAVIHYCEPRYTKDLDIFIEHRTRTFVVCEPPSKPSLVRCPT
jgi:hypothetical protein